eukprot:6184660-Pleurochrysis_carterae.AAC.2
MALALVRTEHGSKHVSWRAVCAAGTFEPRRQHGDGAPRRRSGGGTAAPPAAEAVARPAAPTARKSSWPRCTARFRSGTGVLHTEHSA